MLAKLDRKINFSENTIFYLIIFLPFSLLSGPFLSDLSVSIICLLFFYISYKRKISFYFTNIYSKAFILFFIILLITSIFSIDSLISFKKIIFFFRFWIFALAVWYIFEIKKIKLINNLIYTFTLTFIILIADGYFQFHFGENIFGWPIHGSRVSSLFKDELILGSYLSRLLPVYFALLVYSDFSKKFYQLLLFFFIFVGVETLTFLSGERVAFFFINASSLMLIFLMKNYKMFRLSSIITSIGIILLLINFYPQSMDRIVNRTIDQIGIGSNNDKNLKIKESDIFYNDSKLYIFSIEHQNHYISSIKMFKDNIITGVGPRMFRHLCAKEKYNMWEGCSTHPHNTYVQLLAETGLIGFIFGLIIFLIMIFFLIKHLIFKFIKNKIIFSDFQLCLLSAILISIWPFVPTGDFFNNWLNIIYFFPVGFYLSSVFTKKN
tara:strand:- start:95 stop:1402 length:1308 start_codon:yes stop_codon:yes gene_type:complete